MRLTIENVSRRPADQVERLVRVGLEEIDTSGLYVRVADAGGFRTDSGYTGNARDLSRHDRPEYVPAGFDYMLRASIGQSPVLTPHLVKHATGKAVLAFREKMRTWEGGDPYPEFVGRWPVIFHETWREMLVGIVAHEAEHIHQYRHRASVSELRCEMAHIRALRRYRQYGADAVLLGV